MRCKNLMSLLFVCILCLFVGGVANAEVIYSETFDGDGTSGINETTPTVGENPWASKADFIQTDGSILGGGGNGALAGAAYLPFDPVAGEIYTLMLDMNHTGNNPDALKYIGIGFSSLGTEGSKLDTGYRFPQNGGICYYLYGHGGGIELYEQNNVEIANNGTYIGNEWVTLMIVLDATGDGSSFSVEFFLNGESITVGGPQTIDLGIDEINYCAIGSYGTRDGDSPVGTLVDNFLLFEGSLTPELASSASPKDETTDLPRDGVVLSWTPGEYAAQHDLYLGTDFDNVNDATTAGAVYLDRLAETTYALDRLEFGTTYYWRVDEVNAPPDSTVYKGNVWSFTTEPVGYPIDSANITVTASSAIPTNPPELTIDGSGLDVNDLHSTVPEAMWLSELTGEQPTWIEYEFDKVYKLHEMMVWNQNQFAEPSIGYGFKDVTIEYSTDGVTYSTLGTTHEFTRALGLPGYATDTTVDFEGAAAKYVKLTANSNWSPFGIQQYGLSEVRFFNIPVFARKPNPASGAQDVALDSILSWRAGREGIQHKVNLSTDEQAVIDGTALVDTVTETSYVPALDLASTHYWRIDEVNDTETPTTWQGEVWNLSTQEYVVVDDFEAYNDIDPPDPESHRIFETWSDGWEVATNGAIVGYDPPQPPDAPSYLEQATVYDGSQSLPLFYDNTTATYSEIVANTADLLAGTDWSKYGIKGLTLRFYGDPNNTAQQLYVKVNGTKVAYDGDAENLKNAAWQMWYVDLTTMNVSNVTSLTIGMERIGEIGGEGTLLLDGIRLYSYERDLVTPVDPDPAGLELKFDLDGTAADSSGNGRNGTIVGDPVFEAGVLGQALTFDGVDDYITVDGYKGINADRTDPNNPVQQPFTIACWFKTLDNGEMVTWGSSPGRERMTFRIDGGRLRSEHGAGAQRGVTNTCNDGEWHHAAIVVNEGANITPPNTVLYLDGRPQGTVQTSGTPYELRADVDVNIGRRATSSDRYFPGSLDDVRLYNRTLTPGEVAGMAGLTIPYDTAF